MTHVMHPGCMHLDECERLKISPLTTHGFRNALSSGVRHDRQIGQQSVSVSFTSAWFC